MYVDFKNIFRFRILNKMTEPVILLIENHFYHEKQKA